MRKFSRHRTLEELSAECEKRGWPLDTSRYDKNGEDFVNFRFSCEGESGIVFFNTCNGRFFGNTKMGLPFNSDDAFLDRKGWFKELLNVVYVK